MHFHASYVSTSVFGDGDYYQAMFEAEQDSDDHDSPYLLIQIGIYPIKLYPSGDPKGRAKIPDKVLYLAVVRAHANDERRSCK